MPVTRFPTLRLLAPLLAAPLLVLVLAAPSAPAAGAAAADDVESRIKRCFDLRRNQPGMAVELSARLLDEDLNLEQRIKVLSCQGIALTLAGNPDRAEAIAERILAELGRHPELPPEFRMRALSQAGAILHGAGKIYFAEKIYGETVRVGAQIGGTDAVRAQIATLTNIALIHADFLDSPADAERYYREALALAESSDLPNTQLTFNHALNLLRLGDPDAALEALERAAKSASGSELLGLRIDSALATLRPGHAAPARLATLRGILANQRTLPDPAGEAATLARIATLHIDRGDTAAALQTARRAVERASHVHSPQESYQALQALIDAHAAGGDTAAALENAQRMQEMKLDALRRQRLDLLADLQARTHDAAAQRELERMRYEASIQSLEQEKSHVLRSTLLGFLLLMMLGAITFALLQRRRHRQLRELSERDALTGLANRHAATAALNALATQRSEDDARHVLFLIDVDHFKLINDTHGHHAGDQVLVDVSARLRAACGPDDLVSRWGGEEFLVACANLDPAQAQAMANRLCRAMHHTLETVDGHRTITASLGMAPIPFFDVAPEGHAARRWDYALRMADRALYAAKEHRDSWVGYWGARLPDDATAEAVLEFPEAATGIISIMASRPRDISRAREHSLLALAAQA